MMKSDLSEASLAFWTSVRAAAESLSKKNLCEFALRSSLFHPPWNISVPAKIEKAITVGQFWRHKSSEARLICLFWDTFMNEPHLSLQWLELIRGVW